MTIKISMESVKCFFKACRQATWKKTLKVLQKISLTRFSLI